MQRRESNQRSIRTSSWCSQLNTLNGKVGGWIGFHPPPIKPYVRY